MAIKIGEAVSLNNPENETITPDDRQQTMEIIGGVVVQDYGHVETGDKISWTLQFRKAEWEKVKSYWNKQGDGSHRGCRGRGILCPHCGKELRPACPV